MLIISISREELPVGGVKHRPVNQTHENNHKNMNKLKFCLILAKADDTFAAENKNNNKMEQVNQKTKKDKTVTLFDRIDARTVESSIMGIWKICLEDQQYKEASIKWATENGVSISEIPLTPITFMLSTPGGNCYDGLALYSTGVTSGISLSKR